MVEFFSSIILASVLCSIFTLLTPSGEDKSGRHIRLTAYLVILTVLLSPIARLKSSSSDIKGGADIVNSAVSRNSCDYTDLTIEEIAKSIIILCRDKYSVPEENTTVKLLTARDNGSTVISEIQLYLTGTDKQTRDTVKAYLKAVYGCEIYVLGD